MKRTAAPTGIVATGPNGELFAVNRGDVTLTWRAGNATVSHTLVIRPVDRVEVRCVPSCSGVVGDVATIQAQAYSDDELVMEVEPTCSLGAANGVASPTTSSTSPIPAAQSLCARWAPPRCADLCNRFRA